MSRSMLFYEQAAPVSADRHEGWSVESGIDYAFSRAVNSVPLTTIEFGRAARDYPIVFGRADEQVLPLALLGLEDRQNLHVDDTGGWVSGYVPAFVRRYPFVFATHDGGQTFTVCIDESFAGCNQEGRGERLFDDAGGQSPYLQRMVAFLSEYQRQYVRTRDFCARLGELDVFEPVQANVSLNTGRKLSLTGFHVVGRERLEALSDADLVGLARQDDLELVYSHLASLANFGAMVDRLAGLE